MYVEHLLNVYLNKAKLNFTNHIGNLMEYEATIGEECSLCWDASPKLNYLKPSFRPDYQLRGYLIDKAKGNPEFRISSLGTEVLYITGLTIESELEPYRLPNPEFSSYWEERKKGMGYLFQVIKL